MLIRTVLIEKDPAQLAEIENLLAFYHKFEIVKTFDDIDEASRYLLAQDVDAVFIRSDVGDPARTPDGGFLLSYVTRKKPDLLAVLYSPSRDTAFWGLTVGAAAAFTLPLDPLLFQRAAGEQGETHTKASFTGSDRNISFSAPPSVPCTFPG